MNAELAKAQDVLLERINQICGRFGLNNIMAQLYAVLYLTGGPLSLDDMLERLKISKGSVSINIRALERYGAVRKVWVKGSRKDYYEAEPDIYKVVMDRVKSMAQRRLLEAGEMVKATSQSLNSVSPNNNEDKEQIKIFKERLAKLNSLYNKAQSVFGLLNSSLLNSVLGARPTKSKKEEPVV